MDSRVEPENDEVLVGRLVAIAKVENQRVIFTLFVILGLDPRIHAVPVPLLRSN